MFERSFQFIQKVNYIENDQQLNIKRTIIVSFAYVGRRFSTGVTNRDYLGDSGTNFDKPDGRIISFSFDYDRSESGQSVV
jgi:hypothetical protein